MYETQRTRLRSATTADVDILLALYNDEETNRFMNNTYNFPISRQFIEKQIIALDPLSQFAVIIEHKESGAFMGIITLGIANPKNKDGRIAVTLAKEWRSNGYGTEVITWMVGFCFRELGLHRVSLSVFAINEVAYAVYKRM